MPSGNFSTELLDPQAVVNELDRLDSQDGLIDFIKLAWPILEPTRDFVPGWHIDAICEHLEAVTNGEILRLLINVPPGFMKSLTVDVFWPAWEWGPKNRSDLRYVSSSYSEALTIRDNRRTRNLIRSRWYQSLWGKQFRLVGDQNAKIRFDTDRAGFKIATSVGGLSTGERGDRFIIDDPHNIKDGESEAKRAAVMHWFLEVVPTRVNDPEVSAIVVIMQRVHEYDISGVILEKELGYEHLMLPMEYEPDRHCCTSIGFSDPREEEDELLWPERMTPEVVKRDKVPLGLYGVAAQFQQSPTPRGGGMFKREWFEVVDVVPAQRKGIRGWDLAATETDFAAYTSGCLMSRTPEGVFYIEDVRRLRGSPGKVETAIKNTASLDGRQVEIDLPQDPGQAGKAQVRYLVRQLAGYIVRSSPETGSKESRAEPVASQAEAGNVKLVRGSWIEDFLDEVTTFPRGKYKDQVDSMSRAFARLIPRRREQTTAGPKVVKVHG